MKNKLNKSCMGTSLYPGMEWWITFLRTNKWEEGEKI
jgi:hypothetical protein